LIKTDRLTNAAAQAIRKKKTSAQGFESILARAVNDPDLAELLFSDPDHALVEHDVASEEAALFYNTVYTEFRAKSALPEERKAFGTAGRGGRAENPLIFTAGLQRGGRQPPLGL